MTGRPPTGYTVGTITVEPTSVLAKGDAANLATVTTADTAPISVGAATSTIETDVPLALPSGVVAVGATTVHVTITIKPEDGTRSFQAGLVLTGDQLSIGGPVADLDRLDPGGILVPVDVAGFGPGTHSVQPAPVLQAGLRLLRVDPATVTVTVSPLGSPAPAPSGP